MTKIFLPDSIRNYEFLKIADFDKATNVMKDISEATVAMPDFHGNCYSGNYIIMTVATEISFYFFHWYITWNF